MSEFKRMKKYLANDPECDLCYNSPFSDYIDSLYYYATKRLEKDYDNLFIEPSVQCGMGGVFASFTVDGVLYQTNWDYECECEIIAEYAMEAKSEEALINCIYEYVKSQLVDAEPLDEEDEDDE